MLAHIVEHRRPIAPFGDPASELWVLRAPLAEGRAEVLRAVGLTPAACAPADVAEVCGPALVLDDDVWLNRGALLAFLDAVRSRAEPCALALSAGPVTDLCGGFGGGTIRQGACPLPVAYIPAGRTGACLAGPESLPLTVIDPGGGALRRPGGRPVGSGPNRGLPAPARLGLRIAHWNHLLVANLLGFSAAVADQGRWRNALRVLWAVLRARSFNPHAVAARLNRFGRGCLIHPTAVVEGSVLGERVYVGAHAVVQGCVVGDGSMIDELASAKLSVLGPGARVLRHGLVRFSTLLPGATVGGSVQLSVLGRDASFLHSAYTFDVDLSGRPIRCSGQDGTLQDTSLPYLGCCLGHDAIVGGGVWVAPGRTIPNQVQVIRPPSETLTRIPAGLEPLRPAWVEQGRLVQGGRTEIGER